MQFFTKKFETELNRIGKESTKRVVEKGSEANKMLKRLNSLLSRKDIINVDNPKVDALRMLAFHLEDNKAMSAARLVEILKS